MMCYQKIPGEFLQIYWAFSSLQRANAQKNTVKVPREPRDSSWCLTTCITDSVWPVNCSGLTQMCTRVHTFSHIHQHTHLHMFPIQYFSRHKRGKTCRHGRLSKQLQQIETKLNLKPRATPANWTSMTDMTGEDGKCCGTKGGKPWWRERQVWVREEKRATCTEEQTGRSRTASWSEDFKDSTKG